MKVIFDENISSQLITLLAKNGAPGGFQHVRHSGWSATPDIEWMPIAIQNRWVIFTADRNDQTRGFTVLDAKRSNARMIFLGPF